MWISWCNSVSSTALQVWLLTVIWLKLSREMCRNKSGMAECLKDFSHTWSSTAQGEEGLDTILTVGGETLHWIDGLWLGCLTLHSYRQQEGNHLITASSHSIIKRLKLLLQCGNRIYFPNKSISLRRVLSTKLGLILKLFFSKLKKKKNWPDLIHPHVICLHKLSVVVSPTQKRSLNNKHVDQRFKRVLISSLLNQACLSPLSGALRATSTPSRSPSMAWAITAKTWPSAPPTWRSMIRRRSETAGPSHPPGVCQKAAVWAVSMTSPGLPPCASSTLKVCETSCEPRWLRGMKLISC